MTRTQKRLIKIDNDYLLQLLNEYVSKSTAENYLRLQIEYTNKWVSYTRRINYLKRGYSLKPEAFMQAVKENVKFQKTGLSAKVERFKNKLKFLFS